MPTQENRQYKRLVKFRKDIVGRISQLQSGIRSLLCAQGMNMLTRGKAWTIEGLAILEKHRKPLAECSMEELWRGELDVDLTLLDTLSEQLHKIETLFMDSRDLATEGHCQRYNAVNPPLSLYCSS